MIVVVQSIAFVFVGALAGLLFAGLYYLALRPTLDLEIDGTTRRFTAENSRVFRSGKYTLIRGDSTWVLLTPDDRQVVVRSLAELREKLTVS